MENGGRLSLTKISTSDRWELRESGARGARILQGGRYSTMTNPEVNTQEWTPGLQM